MRDVFIDRDTARVGLYQSLLENAGIACFIRNFHDGGGIAPTLDDPTLCVTHDADYPRAWEIIMGAIDAGPAAAGPDWQCRHCGETVPGTLGACWNCDSARRA